jgi:hypothetical protein
MSAKTVSHCQGKGSITHNNREFVFKNVDPSRTAENITYAKQPLAEAYRECFGEALQRFNEKQTRADRRIDDYYSCLFGNAPKNAVAIGANKQKSFYETLVQVGTKDDSGVGSPNGALAAKCLDEYMRGFSTRNPNFHVFNAVLHMDEATPHLHIDYIPVGHFKRGMDTQNGIAQALKEMGYGSGKDAINRWRLSERKALEGICREHGVEIAEPQQARGYSFTPEEYKAYKDEISTLQKNAVEARRTLENEKRVLEVIEDKKKRLEDAVAALKTKREILTAEELAELKGTKTITGGLKGVTYREYQALKATAEHNHELIGVTNAAIQETAKVKEIAIALKQENQAIMQALQTHFPHACKVIADSLESLKRKKAQANEPLPPPKALSLEEIQRSIKAQKSGQINAANVPGKKDFER